MAGALKRLRRAPAKFLKTGAGWRAVWSDRSRGRQATYRTESSPFTAGWGEPLQVNRRPDGMLFSNYEKAQIAESVAILTVALALALADGIGPALANLSIFAVKLLMSFAAVMTGFLLHELAHKWMAQKYGCWAEYRGNRNGLLLALLMGAFGFLIAAPGAVMVAGHVTPRQHGHIAAVGPLTNIALALAALPFYLLLAGAAGPLGWLGVLARFLVIINIILGGFNMIPVPPLDGSKIMAWSSAAWGGIVAGILALAIVYWTIPPF